MPSKNLRISFFLTVVDCWISAAVKEIKKKGNVSCKIFLKMLEDMMLIGAAILNNCENDTHIKEKVKMANTNNCLHKTLRNSEI